MTMRSEEACASEARRVHDSGRSPWVVNVIRFARVSGSLRFDSVQAVGSPASENLRVWP